MIEVPLYGSSRLGVWRPDREVETTGWELFDTDPMTGTGGGIAGGWERGRVQFELSNHLGNVLVAISDVRIPVLMPEGIELCDDPVHPACYRPIDYYLPQVLTANDYYPFGMGMPGRTYAANDAYRYGFNGQEKSTEIDPNGNSMTAEFWQYDARLGRRWNVDPISKFYESTYAAFSGSPLWFIDVKGSDTILYNMKGVQTKRFIADYKTRDVHLVDLGVANEKLATFEFQGKKYARGFSYYSLFGDPEAHQQPTIFNAVSREITDIGAFLDQEKDVKENFDQVEGALLKRLVFWKNSGTDGQFDYKTKGVLGRNGEGTVYNVDGILYNRHELGMMQWGYIASAVYADHSRLLLHNNLIHQSVEGNGDEWNEMYAWTFGFLHGKNHQSTIATHTAADAQMKIAYPLYWLLPAPYRSDPSFRATPDPDSWKTNLKRTNIITNQ